MTLPQANALTAYWQIVPPAAVQLARIALALGLPPPASQPDKRRRLHTSAHDALREAAAAGIPVMQGRPDDPMLVFLD